MKRLGVALGYLMLVILAVIVVLLASHFWPATALEKEARAALEVPEVLPGTNAWADIATLRHEGLDAAQRQALVDEHVAAFAEWAEQTAGVRYGGKADDSGHLASLPPPPELKGETLPAVPAAYVCGPSACLETVRKAPEAFAAAWAPYAGMVTRTTALQAHGHLRSPYVADFQAHNPALNPLLQVGTARALQFVQGQPEQALEAVCTDMGTARMLLAQGGSLLATMIGQEWLQRSGNLLMAMLAELPRDYPLPMACVTASTPLAVQEMQLCQAVRGEYALSTGLMERLAAGDDRRFFFNIEKSKDTSAVSLGQACLAPVQQAVRDDRPVVIDHTAASSWRFSCLTNVSGCIWASMAGPTYDNYFLKVQDAGANQRLLATWLWLREQPAGSDIPTLLQQVPPALQSAQRPVTLSADGDALQVVRYANGESTEPLRLPLPAAWREGMTAP